MFTLKILYLFKDITENKATVPLFPSLLKPPNSSSINLKLRLYHIEIRATSLPRFILSINIVI